MKLKIPSFEKLMSFGAKGLIGLDIGSHSIKMSEIKNLTLIRYWTKEILSRGTGELSPEEKRSAIVAALKEMVSSQKLKGKSVAMSVSGSSVIVRYVKFPKMSPEDLAKTIQFEAEPYIPFDINDINLATYILRDVVEEGEPKMETVLVASKKDLIEERLKILDEVGLKAQVIDVDAFAVENIHEINCKSEEKETVMLLNMGASISSINILEKGISRVVRDLFIAGDSFTKALSRNLQVDYQTAEKKKKTVGLMLEKEGDEENLKVSNVLSGVVSDLIGEMKRSIDYYQAQAEAEASIEKIILSGGSAKLKNLDKFLEKELNIKTEVVNPFLKISHGKFKEELSEVGPFLAVSLGLATRKAGDTK